MKNRYLFIFLFLISINKIAAQSALALKITAPKTMDGDLSDWDLTSGIQEGSLMQFKDEAKPWIPQDNRLFWVTNWDDTNCYLAIGVEDKEVVAYSSATQEQITFSIGLDTNIRTGWGSTVSNYGKVIRIPADGEAPILDGEFTCNVKFVRTSDVFGRGKPGYVLEIEIPWSNIGSPQITEGTELLFNVHLQDYDNTEIAFDMTVQKKQLKNIFSDVNVWEFRAFWGDASQDKADTYFSDFYPFIERVQFMTATGGSYARDLFIDPEDRDVLDDYKFDALIFGLQEVVRQGIKPMIKTGAVPFKYSSNPVVDKFNVNTSPPSDYDVYYNYIKALAQSIVGEFGIDEVKTWDWGVLTEFENKDWWHVDIDPNDPDSEANPNLSKIAFFKLYDYTVAALQDVIGAENLRVGAHAMAIVPGLWDEELFIDHVATGTNYKTGAIGTQIDFIAASFYSKTPGVASDNDGLSNTINRLRDRAVLNGLNNLEFGIDEGRILSGRDDIRLGGRVTAHSFQGSSDARLFKEMNDVDADWFTTWALSTSTIWGGIPSVGTHFARLSEKMSGLPELTNTAKYIASEPTIEVDGMAAFDAVNHKLYVTVYNYNTDLDAQTKEYPLVRIQNIESYTGNEIEVKQWVLDDTHGNFWPAWAADMETNNITRADFKDNWSMDSFRVSSALLTNSKGKQVWEANKARYLALSTLENTVSVKTIENNSLELPTELEHHAVVFYEISNVKLAE